jgi:hypothetical protein
MVAQLLACRVVDFGSIDASIPQSSQRPACESERLDQLGMALCASEIQWMSRRPTADQEAAGGECCRC